MLHSLPTLWPAPWSSLPTAQLPTSQPAPWPGLSIALQGGNQSQSNKMRGSIEKKKIKILASLQNFFWLKNGLSTLYCVYNHLTMLYKHLSRKSLQHDRSEQQTITDIKEQFFSEKWFHRKKKKKSIVTFLNAFFVCFFFLGTYFKKVRGVRAFSQLPLLKQLLQVRLLSLLLLGHQNKQCCKWALGDTSAISGLHKCRQRKASYTIQLLQVLPMQHWAGAPLPIAEGPHSMGKTSARSSETKTDP